MPAMPSKARQQILNRLSEYDLMTLVIAHAEPAGWAVYHTADSRGSPPGWPDLVLCRPPSIMFIELKAAGGRVSASQSSWNTALIDCGLDARIVYPNKLDDLLDELTEDIDKRCLAS